MRCLSKIAFAFAVFAFAITLMSPLFWDIRAIAGTPGFDCDKAKNPIDKMICSDDELAALDLQLTKTFAQALGRAPADAVTSMKDQQEAWRKNLRNCAKSNEARACTLSSYRARISEL